MQGYKASDYRLRIHSTLTGSSSTTIPHVAEMVFFDNEGSPVKPMAATHHTSVYHDALPAVDEDPNTIAGLPSDDPTLIFHFKTPVQVP